MNMDFTNQSDPKIPTPITKPTNLNALQPSFNPMITPKYELDQEDYSNLQVPLQKNSSSNAWSEGLGLLKFPSTSSYCVDLSRHGSDQPLKAEENLADLLGADYISLTAKLAQPVEPGQSAPAINLKSCDAETKSPNHEPNGQANKVHSPMQSKAQLDKSPGKKASKPGAYFKLNEMEMSAENHQNSPNLRGRTLDADINTSTGAELKQSISNVNDQDIYLNVPSPGITQLASPTSDTAPLTAAAPVIPQLTPDQIRYLNLSIPECEIYLYKAMVFFFSLSLCGFLTWLMGPIPTFEAVMAGPFLFCASVSLIDIFKTIKLLDYLWFDYGDVFYLFDVTNCVFFMLALEFKITAILPTSSYASVFFWLAAHSYAYFSKGKIRQNLELILTRYFYGAQVLAFTLKFDDYGDWSWKETFLLSYIFLGIKVVFFFYKISKMFYRILTESGARKRTKVAGYIWYVVYNSMILVPIGIIAVINDATTPPRTIDRLAPLAKAFAFIGATMFIYCLVFRLYVRNFILRFNVTESRLAQHEEEQDRLKEKKEIRLELEMKESYFVMVSSTYFLPLHKSFYAKGKESLTKIKQIFSKFKIGTKAVKAASKPQVRHESLADIKQLHQNKKELDIKLSKLDDIQKNNTGRSPNKKLTERLHSRNTKDIDEIEENSIMKDDKLALSLDDLEKFQKLKIHTPKNKSNDDEEVCYLCYVNPRDAVLMNCGHGGICYECACNMVKLKDECMECRKSVREIYKIDPNPKLFDIVKAEQVQKVVVKITTSASK